MNHVIADPATGTIYAGGGDSWFGPAVWKSEDLGASWTHSSEGLAYGEGEEPIKAVWSLAPGHGELTRGSSRPGCSGATIAASPFATSPVCAITPRGRTGSPAPAG